MGERVEEGLADLLEVAVRALHCAGQVDERRPQRRSLAQQLGQQRAGAAADVDDGLDPVPVDREVDVGRAVPGVAHQLVELGAELRVRREVVPPGAPEALGVAGVAGADEGLERAPRVRHPAADPVAGRGTAAATRAPPRSSRRRPARAPRRRRASPDARARRAAPARRCRTRPPAPRSGSCRPRGGRESSAWPRRTRTTASAGRAGGPRSTPRVMGGGGSHRTVNRYESRIPHRRVPARRAGRARLVLDADEGVRRRVRRGRHAARRDHRLGLEHGRVDPRGRTAADDHRQRGRPLPRAEGDRQAELRLRRRPGRRGVRGQERHPRRRARARPPRRCRAAARRSTASRSPPTRSAAT